MVQTKTKCMLMMAKVGSTQIVNFMTPGAEILAVRCGHISRIGNMNYSLKIFFFTLMHRSDKLSI